MQNRYAGDVGDFGKLGYMVCANQCSVQSLEALGLVLGAEYYHERLLPSRKDARERRRTWYENAIQELRNTDIVFLDPDNGLLPKSISQSDAKSVKYARQQEIIDYYSAGHSVVFYNHRWRMVEDAYLSKIRTLLWCKALHGARIAGVKYVRGTVRDYFFLLQPQH